MRAPGSRNGLSYILTSEKQTIKWSAQHSPEHSETSFLTLSALTVPVLQGLRDPPECLGPAGATWCQAELLRADVGAF